LFERSLDKKYALKASQPKTGPLPVQLYGQRIKGEAHIDWCVYEPERMGTV